jgi:hypothetical protein
MEAWRHWFAREFGCLDELIFGGFPLDMILLGLHAEMVC